MLLSVLVALNLGRPLVPWTIVEVIGEDQTFLTLFEKLQAGCFDAVEVCDDLKRAVLLRTFVGAKMETLMVASSGQSVLRVCAQFGNYVKFVFELPELKDPEPVLLPGRVCYHEGLSETPATRRQRIRQPKTKK